MRGLGLALLAGLPLYSVGRVLSAIAGTSSSGRRVAVSAAVGGTAGALLVGLVLVSSLMPVSMYGFCLVALSGAALVHGRVLDRRPEEHLVDEGPSLFGQVQVVDRRWGTPRRSQRLLLVGGRLVGGTEEDEALRPWESAAAALLPRTHGDERPVLVIGGSSVVLINRLMAEGIPVVVVERNVVVRRMTRRHFGLGEGSQEGASRKVFEGDELPDGDLFRAVVVDGAALSSGEPIYLPTSSELRRFRDLTARDGFLLLGGDDPTHLLGEEAQAVLRARTAPAGWTEATIYRSLDGEKPGDGLMAFGAVAAFPRRIGEMMRVELPGQKPIPIEDLAPEGDPDALSLEGTVDEKA